MKLRKFLLIAIIFLLSALWEYLLLTSGKEEGYQRKWVKRRWKAEKSWLNLSLCQRDPLNLSSPLFRFLRDPFEGSLTSMSSAFYLPAKLRLRNITLRVKYRGIAIRTSIPHTYLILGGSRDGIEPLDPVIYDGYLVGVVFKVFHDYSLVKSIASPDVSLTVTALTPDCLLIGFGIVQGNGDDLKLTMFKPSDSLKPSFTLVTSGQGLYPLGIRVGIYEGSHKSVDMKALGGELTLTVVAKRISLKEIPPSLREVISL